MPSGNAIYTYTGKEPSVTIQGHEFVKDKPSLVRDNGVIAVCAARKDFEPTGKTTQTGTVEQAMARATPEVILAKPKGKAK